MATTRREILKKMLGLPLAIATVRLMGGDKKKKKKKKKIILTNDDFTTSLYHGVYNGN